MLSSLKTRLRRLIRGYQRSALYPVLLPHHRLTDTGVTSLTLPGRELPEPVRRALSFCDGSNTVAQVAQASSASRSHLIAAQEGELILLWPRPVPASPPAVTDAARVTRVILSPHPDDAALSLGGAMLAGSEPEPDGEPVPAAADDDGAAPPATTGDEPTDAQFPPELSGPAPAVPAPAPAAQTLVVNVFTHSAWWRFTGGADAPDPADRPAIQVIRAAEDDLVSRLSGCPMRALGLDEALLRGHDMADIFTAPVGERDAGAAAAVGAAVTGLAAEFPAATFELPLGIGRHVDHRLVRDAALAALRGAGVPAERIRFYEDLPYAATGETSDFPEAHAGVTLKPAPVDVTGQIDAKIEMVRAYWSQFSWSQIPELKASALEAGTGRYVERGHAAAPVGA